MPDKFKEGDEVRVVGGENCHHHIGMVGRVQYVTPTNYRQWRMMIDHLIYEVRFGPSGEYNFFREEELEAAT